MFYTLHNISHMLNLIQYSLMSINSFLRVLYSSHSMINNYFFKFHILCIYNHIFRKCIAQSLKNIKTCTCNFNSYPLIYRLCNQCIYHYSYSNSDMETSTVNNFNYHRKIKQYCICINSLISFLKDILIICFIFFNNFFFLIK
jgi:hypothetical protein